MSAAPRSALSPAQAAKLVGVSRWTILRAVKSLGLKAQRDNSGHWRIRENDLREWSAAQGAHMGQAEVPAQVAHHDLTREIAVLSAKLAAVERARDQAEGERDRWQRMAERLAEGQARRGWFRWRR